MILMRNSQSDAQMGMIFWHSRRFILPDENNAWFVVRSSYAEIDEARLQEPRFTLIIQADEEANAT